MGKPLLIYSHPSDVRKPLTALHTAIARINRLNPRWLSLNNIAKKLYLKKDENKHYSHIWMFSREIEYTNTAPYVKTLNFYRYENNLDDFQVYCGEKLSSHTIRSNYLIYQTAIDPEQTITVRVQKQPLPLPSTIAKSPLKVIIRRYASDLRHHYFPLCKTLITRNRDLRR